VLDTINKEKLSNYMYLHVQCMVMHVTFVPPDSYRHLHTVGRITGLEGL